MNKVIIFFISFIFIAGCSLNKNSKFWTKSENIPEEKNENYKKIFVEEPEPVIVTRAISSPSREVPDINPSHNLEDFLRTFSRCCQGFINRLLQNQKRFLYSRSTRNTDTGLKSASGSNSRTLFWISSSAVLINGFVANS